MRLYKTIEYDKEMIAGIKRGEYPNWKISFENSIYVDIVEIKN